MRAYEVPSTTKSYAISLNPLFNLREQNCYYLCQFYRWGNGGGHTHQAYDRASWPLRAELHHHPTVLKELLLITLLWNFNTTERLCICTRTVCISVLNIWKQYNHFFLTKNQFLPPLRMCDKQLNGSLCEQSAVTQVTGSFINSSFTHLILQYLWSEMNQTQHTILCDSIYMRFNKRQNQGMVTEMWVVIASVKKDQKERAWRNFKAGWKFFILILVIVHACVSLPKFIKLYTSETC